METEDEQIFISNSVVSDNIQVYFRAYIVDSEVNKKCIIGENSRVRQSYLKEYVRIDRNNLIMGCNVGRYSYTGPFNMIFNSVIGDFCSISYGVTIGPPDHDFSRISTHPFLHNQEYDILNNEDLMPVSKFDRPCEIGADVWIGCNATILRGVKIGCGAVIGANALVRKDVPPYAIVGGVPAKIIKYRFPQNIIDQLLQIEWWTWDIERIRKNAKILTGNITSENLKKIK